MAIHTAAYNAGRVAGALIRRVEPLDGRAAGEGAAKSAVPHHRPTGVWSRRRQDRQGVNLRAMRRLGDILELKDADGALASRAIAGLASDSRKIAPGDVFFALAGAKDDGLKHVGEALAKGAAAVVAERWTDIPNAAFVKVADARAALATPPRASIRASRRPSSPSPAPAEKPRSPPSCARSGKRSACNAASIGTIGVVSRPLTVYGSLTTPDPIALHELLDRLAASGVTHLAMEASSHGLDSEAARRRAPRRRRVHQSHARPHGLPRDDRGLSRGQAQAVPRPPARSARRP